MDHEEARRKHLGGKILGEPVNFHSSFNLNTFISRILLLNNPDNRSYDRIV